MGSPRNPQISVLKKKEIKACVSQGIFKLMHLSSAIPWGGGGGTQRKGGDFVNDPVEVHNFPLLKWGQKVAKVKKLPLPEWAYWTVWNHSKPESIPSLPTPGVQKSGDV